MPTDDDSTPRTPHRPTSHPGEDVTRFRLDRIEAQNDEQSRKLDKMTKLLTQHVERQDFHEKRIARVEGGFIKIIWTVLLAAVGTIGSMVLGLLHVGTGKTP